MLSNDFSKNTHWEGHHIGDVSSIVKLDKEVIHCKLGKTGTFMDEKIVVLKYNVIALIINSIRRKFCLAFSRYLCCTFKGEEAMICKHLSGTLTLKQFSLLPHPFYDEEDPMVMQEIRYCIAFRYLFFIPEDDEGIFMHILGDSIYCHITKKISVMPISKYETSYDLTNNNLPTYSIARFFKGDNDFFRETVIKLIGKRTIDSIREHMIESISKWDNIEKYMDWVDAVHNRIQLFI